MPLAAPQGLLNAFVGQAGHGEACMGDPKAGLLLSEDLASSLYSLPSALVPALP